jgi:ATP-dependent RNA helicase RhlB
MTDTYLSERPITDLGLLPELLQGAIDAGFQYCTEIQSETLPMALAGQDVAGQAQTGTGKTAAFLLAAMQHILTRPPRPKHEAGDPRVLILAPTRELAVQIARDAQALGRHTALRTVVVFGGAGYDEQREALRRGVDILVGTPGRLIDYLRQQVFSLLGVQVVVLDEADRMFDLGFIKDIRFVLRRLPPPDERLNMLFSATLSQRVMELAYEHMNNATLVNVSPPDRVTAERVTQVVYHPSAEEKVALLVGLLRHMDPKRSLIFTNTRRAADRVRAYLVGNGFDAEVLSGDVPQRQRLKLLGRFSAGDLPVLVATDVAARGLHIPDVSHVFNFDLPQDAEDYIHRIGRTARAGASGDAVSFACEEYAFSLQDIEALIGQKIPVAPVTEELLGELRPPARRERRGPLGGESGGRRGERPRGRASGGASRSSGPSRPSSTARPSRPSRGTGPSRRRPPAPAVAPAESPGSPGPGAEAVPAAPAASAEPVVGEAPSGPPPAPRRRRRRRKKPEGGGVVGGNTEGG